MKKISLKRSFLLSCLSVVLCVSVLIGTTFAWFTDSVTSENNRITAGNLDVEMYYKNAFATDWSDVAAMTGNKFFVDSTGGDILWEPGAVAVTQFKVVNEGSLALKYLFQMADQGHNSVTVGGTAYSLIDVLKVAVLDGEQVLTREAAIAAAAGSLESFDSFTDAAQLEAATEKAFTVVVYWEPSAGDDNLNLNNGAIAYEAGGEPSDPNTLYINIDIRLNATQATSEEDAFDRLYDVDAEVGGITIPVITNFTEVKSVNIGANGETVTPEVVLANPGKTVEVIVPAGVVTVNEPSVGDAEDKPLTLSIENVEGDVAAATFNITVEAGRTLAAYDISIEEVADTNTTPIAVNLFVGKGLVLTNVFHNGTPMDSAEWSYDPITGIITVYTTQFSNFAFEIADGVAKIGNSYFESVKDAYDAAVNGDTITLNKNCNGNGITFKTGKDVTIDFGGHTFIIDGTTVGSTGTTTNGFQILRDSNITLKNGTLTCSKAKMLIQNYANLTLIDMVLDGANLITSTPYTLSNNCGTVNINNTTIIGRANGYAFDAYYWPSNSYIEGVTVNVNAGSVISGKVQVGWDNTVADYAEWQQKCALNVNNGFALVETASGTNSKDYKFDLIENAGAYEIYNSDGLRMLATNINYANKPIKIMADIDLGDKEWKPLNLKNITQIDIDGNGHTISNMKVRTSYDGGNYGGGFIGNTNGKVSIKNITFSNADVSIKSSPVYSGNVVGIVLGYAYSTAFFENVKVQNSEVWGYGKVGTILGMGADPNVTVTFKDCVSTGNKIHGVYDVGGLAGLIYRNGTDGDRTVITNCTVNNTWVKNASERYDALDTTITCAENAVCCIGHGAVIKGEYWPYVQGGVTYYFPGYADYYCSYGGVHDCTITGIDGVINGSDYLVNKD